MVPTKTEGVVSILFRSMTVASQMLADMALYADENTPEIVIAGRPYLR